MNPFDPTAANRATVDVDSILRMRQRISSFWGSLTARGGRRRGAGGLGRVGAGGEATVNLFFSRRTANCGNACSRIAAAAVAAAAAAAAERREKEEPDYVPRQNA